MTSSHTDVLTALTMPIGARLLVGHVSEADRHNPQVPALPSPLGDGSARRGRADAGRAP
jgi:hypothetical protein